MNRIVVEVWSSLAHLFPDWSPTEKRRGHISFTVEVPEGATLETLLRQLAEDNRRFGDYMYDPATGEPTELVTVVVNGELPELKRDYETALHDNDVITLVQAYAGG